MAFDADAAVEALSPPSFTAGGRTYRGRIVSVPEVVRLQAREMRLQSMREQAEQTEDVAGAVPPNLRRLRANRYTREVQRFTRDLICSWFPRRWWQFGNPAWRAFRQLPEVVQAQAIASFSEAQRNALPTGATPATGPTE